ncbi:MAG: phenylalanine--tRNA ligase subunit beta [Prevotellaceae bacterium]|nr:phenylalanine--tRNA ligase subunit beta [Prevotellaceae bacterium]
MNISYNWLRQHIDLPLTPAETAEALTSIGLEVGSVEEVQSIRGGLKGLVVAKVLTCEPHSDSDHMHVTTVDLGQGEPVQIVCGAPNVAAGQKVIVATLGTVLYDGDKAFQIKRSKLRGVESFGMICAEDEIGIGTSHDGIIVLPETAVVGTPAAEYYGLESDWLIEVDILPNRADAASHYGVARDLYAYLRHRKHAVELHRMDVSAFRTESTELDFSVEVENAEACPRYAAVALKGCRVQESPDWLKRLLTTVGLRPINNIVDVTNYIMLSYGQPLHCFDADMIGGRTIRVRTLPDGTKFQTLDGVERTLAANDLCICDDSGPMCIAGIFGGRGSGTYETTTDVILESAYFHPTWIRKSARRHGLQTDASFRFERGIDPDGQIFALKAAALLCKELSGCRIASEIKDIEAPGRTKWFHVDLDCDYLDSLTGKHIPADTARAICESLEMKVSEATGDDGRVRALSLEVPAYRTDVQRPCDVVEDILRIYGYNNIEIPSAIRSSLTIKGETDRSYKLETLISQQLVGEGFNEILNNSLTGEAYYEGLRTHSADSLVRLLNPLSGDLGVMRATLLYGGLETIAHNVNRKQKNLRLFEFGNCYACDASRREEGKPLAPYREDYRLGLWLTGARVENSWAHADEDSSVYELKAYVRNILLRLGVAMGGLLVETGDNDIFSKSIVVKDRNGNIYMELGLVARRECAKCGVEQEVYFAELRWMQLMRHTRKAAVKFSEISKYPAVSRDLALLVDKAVEFARIEQIARQQEKKLLRRVELFDVYEGKNLEAGKKSYAVNFVLQDDTKTMNDKQVEAVMKKITAALEKQLGARLR